MQTGMSASMDGIIKGAPRTIVAKKTCCSSPGTAKNRANNPKASAEITGNSLSKYSRVGLWSIGGKTRKKNNP